MKKLITKLFIGGALTVIMGATPSFASMLFSFTYSPGGSFTTASTTNGAAVTGLTDDFSGFTILNTVTFASTTYTFNGLATYNQAGKTLAVTVNDANGVKQGGTTLAGTAGAAGLNLFTINFSSALTDSCTGTCGVGTATTVLFNTATSLSNVSSAFFSDVGFNPSTFVGLQSGNGVTATSGETGAGTDTYNINTSTVSFTLTPEPMSFLMMGTGLIAISFIGRKRFNKKPATDESK